MKSFRCETLLIGCVLMLLSVPIHAALPADFNADGGVDLQDLQILANQWYQPDVPEVVTNGTDFVHATSDANEIHFLPVDFNHDWLVNYQDFYLFSYQWQREENPELILDLKSKGYIEGLCNYTKGPYRSFPDKRVIARWIYNNVSSYQVTDKDYFVLHNALTIDSDGLVRFRQGGYNSSPYRLDNKYPFDPPIQLDGSKIIKLRYRVNAWQNPDDQSRFRSLGIRFYYAGGYCDYQPLIYLSKAQVKKEMNVGWHEVVIRFDQPQQNCVPPIDQDITGIQIRLMFFDDSFTRYDTARADITFDMLEAYDLVTKPQVALTFDDGYSNQYGIARYLHEKGLHATFYIVPAWINKPFYLTMDQLKTMQQQGHLIANHTWDHLDVSVATVAQYKASIQNAANWLVQHGFGEGAFVFCSPKGTPDVTQDKIDAALSLVRQLRLTTAPTYVPEAYYLDYNPELLYAAGVGAGNDLTSCYEALTKAYSEQTFRGVYFHSYFWELMPFIDQVAQDVADGKIECVRMDELLTNWVQ